MDCGMSMQAMVSPARTSPPSLQWKRQAGACQDPERQRTETRNTAESRLTRECSTLLASPVVIVFDLDSSLEAQTIRRSA